jgi:hypothetical protein
VTLLLSFLAGIVGAAVGWAAAAAATIFIEEDPRKAGPGEGFEVRYRMIWPQ